jgi:hypothetical protein
MEGRSVLQWDKDDCAAAGLVKFDLLGLGMLTMLHLAVDLVREHEGVEIDLATIPRRTRSTTCCARPTPSACSRWRAARRWARCRGCGRAPSTTS